MENLAETIKHISFFSGLSREDVARIAGKLEEERFSAGQVKELSTAMKQRVLRVRLFFYQASYITAKTRL